MKGRVIERGGGKRETEILATDSFKCPTLRPMTGEKMKVSVKDSSEPPKNAILGRPRRKKTSYLVYLTKFQILRQKT